MHPGNLNLEKLKKLNKEFKAHKRRQMIKSYLIRFFIILMLLAIISSTYTIYVGYSVSKKLSSHKGIQEAKKALAKRQEPQEPFNVLLLGSDRRGEDRGRSDTIIVMRVIPKERKAFLVSIPRDYRVEIPGYGKRKINAAFSLGGPSLAIKTISNYLGVPIHHYAVIDFEGFVKVVDALGGVYINVEKRLYEPNSSRVNLFPGYQKLNGSQALSYVRFRHDEEGDFGRIRRQQQFIKALAKKLLEPSSIPKYPRIANLVAENVETDMSLTELISLAKYFSSSGGVKIESVMLPGVPKNIAGASFVIPDEAKVRIIVQAIFNENRMPSADELIDPSTITVKVFNGTKKPGLARAFASFLRDLGFNIYATRNADRSDYMITLIVYKPGHKEEADFLKKQIQIGEVVEAGEAQYKLLGKASIGLILGIDSLEKKEVQERLR